MSRFRTWAGLGLAMVMVLGLAGCGGSGQGLTGATATRAAVPAQFELIDIGDLGGGITQWAEANSLSNTGVVTCTSYDPASGYDRAVRWQDGRMTRLAVPKGARSSHGLGVNDAGEVVGYYQDARNVVHATRWDASGALTLFDMSAKDSKGLDANNRGQYLGGADLTVAQELLELVEGHLARLQQQRGDGMA